MSSLKLTIPIKPYRRGVYRERNTQYIHCAKMLVKDDTERQPLKKQGDLYLNASAREKVSSQKPIHT